MSGNAIRRRREAANLTQEQVEQRSGISVSQLSRLENGRHLPQRRTLIALASALGCAPDALRDEIMVGGASCPGCGAALSPDTAICPLCCEVTK